MTSALDDMNLRALATRYGTPYYAYDFGVFERQARLLRGAIPSRFELFYAVKANPSLAVLRLFSMLGLGADIASAGELAAALAAGFDPKRIVMAGPGKSERDLAAATEAGILGINVEGPAELDRLQRRAEKLRRSVRIQLRLNPKWNAGERTPIISGSGSGKFGMSLRLAREVLANRSRWPRLSMVGFHVFQASDVLDADAFVSNVRRVVDLVRRLSTISGLSPALVDLGGGFGVPYARGEKPLDLKRLRRGLAETAAEIAGEKLFAETRFLFEPGRFLTAQAGVYVCRVLEVKERGETLQVVVDGGIHHLLRPRLVGPHPVRLVCAGGKSTKLQRVTIGGPLCTSLDVFAESVRLPKPSPGDLVVIGNAGAYGYTESMPLFLSHEWPAEIGVRGRRHALLRKPPLVADLLRGQRPF